MKFHVNCSKLQPEFHVEFPVIEWIRENFHVDFHVAFYVKFHVDIFTWEESARFFTFSSEKVLDLCKIWPPPHPPFSSNLHVLRPPESENRGFAKVCLSVCLSACIHDNFWKNWPIGLKLGTLVECQEMKVKFVSQPFLTNGSGFIHKKRFLPNKKIYFPAKLFEIWKNVKK